jgi:hypothetical protein
MPASLERPQVGSPKIRGVTGLWAVVQATLLLVPLKFSSIIGRHCLLPSELRALGLLPSNR